MERPGEYSEEIEKVVNRKNEDCRLFGTEECDALNPERCADCSIGAMKADKQEEIKASIRRLIDAAHPEELEPLYTSEECLFCREGHNKTDRYALFDLAKRDPEGDWTIGFGSKKIGVKGKDMILPLQVSCCKKCSRRYGLFSYLPSVIGLVIFAAGLVVTTSKGVYKALYQLGSFVPALVMAGFIVLAVLAGAILKLALASGLSKKMHTDVADIPEIKKLMDEGWREVSPKKAGVSALVFAKERREHGVCSRIGEKPVTFPDGYPQICGIWPAENVPDDGEEEPENE